jgi:hypothetical protein
VSAIPEVNLLYGNPHIQTAFPKAPYNLLLFFRKIEWKYLMFVASHPIIRRTLSNQVLAPACRYLKEKETGGEKSDFSPVRATARRET